MTILATLTAAVAVFAALGAISFNVSKDAQYHMCLLANTGWLDFMGPEYNKYWEGCIGDASAYFLKRDYPPGGGSLTKIHEVDCSNGFTFEQMAEESNGFTKPFICRKLLKDNECTKWDLNYLASKANEEEFLNLIYLGNANYSRKAFSSPIYPARLTPAIDGFNK